MKTTEIYCDNIEKKTLNNENYREIVYTVPERLQLVVMSVEPNKSVPKEIHPNTTQFIRVESGKGKAIISYPDGEKSYNLKDGVSVIIPPGLYHEIKNTGKDDLKLYTLYTPPEHPVELIEK